MEQNTGELVVGGAWGCLCDWFDCVGGVLGWSGWVLEAAGLLCAGTYRGRAAGCVWQLVGGGRGVELQLVCGQPFS